MALGSFGNAANIRAVLTLEDKASAGLAGFGRNLGGLKGAALGAAKSIAAIGIAAGAAAAGGMALAAKAAFDQVRAVQNASFALKAYEKDAGKVNAVLSELVAFARSDMGVLFQREDLFKAASALKVVGVATTDLTRHVKTMAKISAVGIQTWDEFTPVIQRVISTGKLGRVEFEQLQKAGIRLDESMANASITADELFAAIDSAIPADILKGRANTIDGAFIQLQSSFRDLGSAILGVDAQTSEFIEGGLGDTFMQIIRDLRDALKDPAIKEGLAAIGQGIVTIINFIRENGPIVIDAFRRAWEFLQPLWERLTKVIMEELWPSLKILWEQLRPYAPLLGAILVGAIAALIFGLLALAKILTLVINTISWLITQTQNMNNAFMVAVGIAGRVFGAIGTFAINLQNQINKTVAQIIGLFVHMWESISGIIDRIGGRLSQIGEKVGSVTKNIPFLQHGGFIGAGQPAVVGERGPELFVPSTGGQVIPGARGGGGGGTIVNINVGLMTGSAIERRDAAMKMFEDLKAIAGSKGQTVSEFLGQA